MKKGAIELSVGTIVIIVLAMLMLILGIVLVRNIMCGSINLVTITEGKVKGEIDKLFQSRGGEVVCLGAGEEAVALVPGKSNIIYCGIKAQKQAEYSIRVKRMGGIVQEKEIERWVLGSSDWKGNVAPGDETPKKFLRLDVPENSPEGLISIDIEVYRDGNLIASPTLDFDIKRMGFFRSATC